jgi:glycosyltransferase involved in cell wall biosynthesis
MLLSICIATRNRSEFLLETVRCLLDQIGDDVEIVIVDGASSDDSKKKIESLNLASNKLRYFYEETNSGVDRDFDKSVEYALGKYCWLFSDDDLLEPNAISLVKSKIQKDPDLLVVNSSIHSKFFEKILCNDLTQLNGDISYDQLGEKAFLDLASYLSFIGAIVVNRDFWLSRKRKIYHGSAFAHLGVLFQNPLPDKVYFLAEPLIKIRYGNSEWAPRGFNIWFKQWPSQVMILDDLPYELRKKVANNSIIGLCKFCLLYRAMGLYNHDIYKLSVKGEHTNFEESVLKLISLIPIKPLNTILTIGFLKNNTSLVNIYRLSNSIGSTSFSKWISNKLRLNAGITKN